MFYKNLAILVGAVCLICMQDANAQSPKALINLTCSTSSTEVKELQVQANTIELNYESSVQVATSGAGFSNYKIKNMLAKASFVKEMGVFVGESRTLRLSLENAAGQTAELKFFKYPLKTRQGMAYTGRVKFRAPGSASSQLYSLCPEDDHKQAFRILGQLF